MRLVLVAAATLPVAILLSLLIVPKIPYLVAPLLNDTPEARLEDYFEAIARGDADAALLFWKVDPGRKAEELGSRRASVTADLASQRPRSWTVEHAEWWGMCCMPHIVDSRDQAGGARFTVSVDGKPYRFDIIAMDHGGSWEGLPSRGWVLRDVYPVGAPPLYNASSGR